MTQSTSNTKLHHKHSIFQSMDNSERFQHPELYGTNPCRAGPLSRLLLAKLEDQEEENCQVLAMDIL